MVWEVASRLLLPVLQVRLSGVAIGFGGVWEANRTYYGIYTGNEVRAGVPGIGA